MNDRQKLLDWFQQNQDVEWETTITVREIWSWMHDFITDSIHVTRKAALKQRKNIEILKDLFPSRKQPFVPFKGQYLFL